MKLAEIAQRICVHLRRMEADPEINTVRNRLKRYWSAGSFASGRFVYVCYVGYQGNIHLTRDQAEKYLAWLDAGNSGTHHKALAS